MLRWPLHTQSQITHPPTPAGQTPPRAEPLEPRQLLAVAVPNIQDLFLGQLLVTGTSARFNAINDTALPVSLDISKQRRVGSLDAELRIGGVGIFNATGFLKPDRRITFTFENDGTGAIRGTVQLSGNTITGRLFLNEFGDSLEGRLRLFSEPTTEFSALRIRFDQINFFDDAFFSEFDFITGQGDDLLIQRRADLLFDNRLGFFVDPFNIDPLVEFVDTAPALDRFTLPGTFRFETIDRFDRLDVLGFDNRAGFFIGLNLGFDPRFGFVTGRNFGFPPGANIGVFSPTGFVASSTDFGFSIGFLGQPFNSFQVATDTRPFLTPTTFGLV